MQIYKIITMVNKKGYFFSARTIFGIRGLFVSSKEKHETLPKS
jgi:hypothetical protein